MSNCKPVVVDQTGNARKGPEYKLKDPPKLSPKKDGSGIAPDAGEYEERLVVKVVDVKKRKSILLPLQTNPRRPRKKLKLDVGVQDTAVPSQSEEEIGSLWNVTKRLEVEERKDLAKSACARRVRGSRDKDLHLKQLLDQYTSNRLVRGGEEAELLREKQWAAILKRTGRGFG